MCIPQTGGTLKYITTEYNEEQIAHARPQQITNKTNVMQVKIKEEEQ